MALTKIDDRGLTTPIDLLDNEKIQFGTGNDLQLYHNGTDSYLKNTTNDLYIHNTGDDTYIIATDDIYLKNGDDWAIKCIGDGAVELYHDNAKKFETLSTGVSISGNLDADQIDVGDAQEIRLGASADLKLVHDGTHSWVQNATGNLYLGNSSGNANHVHIQAKYGDEGIVVYDDAQVELYYDNSKKFYTHSTGCAVTGELAVSDSVTLADGDKLKFGHGYDLEIYHDGTENRIEAANGALDLRTTTSANIEILANDKYSVWGEADGMTALYWNGARKFETTQYGAKINTNLSSGYLEVSTTANLGDGHIEIIGGEAGGAVLSFTADEGDDNADKWRIQNAGDSLLGFRTKDSGSWVQKMKIGNDGHVTIDDGNLILASGHGIQFSGYDEDTTDGNNINSNTLDDYEEGTWGSLTGSAVGSATISNNRYTRVGNLVTLNAYITSMSTFSSGHAFELNVPFTVVGEAVGSVLMQHVHWDESSASFASTYVWTANKLRIYITRDDSSWYTVAGDHLSTNSDIYVQISYHTTS
jgi:hypothetical protein